VTAVPAADPPCLTPVLRFWFLVAQVPGAPLANMVTLRQSHSHCAVINILSSETVWFRGSFFGSVSG
jgi:hypothetical protein